MILVQQKQNKNTAVPQKTRLQIHIETTKTSYHMYIYIYIYIRWFHVLSHVGTLWTTYLPSEKTSPKIWHNTVIAWVGFRSEKLKTFSHWQGQKIPSQKSTKICSQIQFIQLHNKIIYLFHIFFLKIIGLTCLTNNKKHKNLWANFQVANPSGDQTKPSCKIGVHI